jgi:hypothetical protein
MNKEQALKEINTIKDALLIETFVDEGFLSGEPVIALYTTCLLEETSNAPVTVDGNLLVASRSYKEEEPWPKEGTPCYVWDVNRTPRPYTRYACDERGYFEDGVGCTRLKWAHWEIVPLCDIKQTAAFKQEIKRLEAGLCTIADMARRGHSPKDIGEQAERVLTTVQAFVARKDK